MAFGGGGVTVLIYVLSQGEGGTRVGQMLLAGISINALALGEAQAALLGVSVQRLKKTAIVVVALAWCCAPPRCGAWAPRCWLALATRRTHAACNANSPRGARPAR